MSGSNINPNTWKGEVRSGGYIVRNRNPASANSPHWKGKYYLIGYGWVWVSGWDRHGEEMIRLSLEDLTDEQARKFCRPKSAPYQANPGQERQNGATPPPPKQGDIPF